MRGSRGRRRERWASRAPPRRIRVRARVRGTRAARRCRRRSTATTRPRRAARGIFCHAILGFATRVRLRSPDHSELRLRIFRAHAAPRTDRSRRGRPRECQAAIRSADRAGRRKTPAPARRRVRPRPSGGSGLKTVSCAMRVTTAKRGPAAAAVPRDQTPRHQPPNQARARPKRQRDLTEHAIPPRRELAAASSISVSWRNQATASLMVSRDRAGRAPAEFVPRLRVAEKLQRARPAAPSPGRRARCRCAGLSRSKSSPQQPIRRMSAAGRHRRGAGRPVSRASKSRKSLSHRFSSLRR